MIRHIRAIMIVAVSVLFGCVVTSVQQRGPVANGSQSALAVDKNQSPEQPMFALAPPSKIELHGTTSVGPWAASSSDVHAVEALPVDRGSFDALFDRLERGEQPDLL